MADSITMESKYKFRNGVEIPLLGFCTDEIASNLYNIQTQAELFLAAIDIGYRYFDTSEYTGGLRALGQAIRESGIPREEFFIASKMRMDEMCDGRFHSAIDETLLELGMDYLDLYTLHWPAYLIADWPRKIAFLDAYCGRERKKEDNGDSEGLISFYQKGFARTIGVCNFKIHHMEELLNDPRCSEEPMINMSHFHPLFANTELRLYCEEKGILFGGLFEENELIEPTKPRISADVERRGLLFQTDSDHIQANHMVSYVEKRRYSDITKNPNDITKNPRRKKGFFDDCDGISRIAVKYGKTNNQIVTRWSLQHGVVTTVKAFLPDQMYKECQVFDFELEPEDMKVIDAYNIGMRFGFEPDYIDF